MVCFVWWSVEGALHPQVRFFLFVRSFPLRSNITSYFTSTSHRSRDSGQKACALNLRLMLDSKNDLSRGVGFVLFDNIWGTNYPMYYPWAGEYDEC